MTRDSFSVCVKCEKMDCVYFVLSLILIWTQNTVLGQGRMLLPPSRSSMWRVGYDTPINHNDNVQNCGGTLYRYTKANGKCGVCGDPWDYGRRENEAGGVFANGIVTGVYITGSTIDVVIDDVVASGGYFEFRLCDNKQLAVHDPHKCFQNGLLTVKDSSSRLFNIKNGENKLKLILPTNVTCDQCVLQWKYRTAEHFGCAKENGKEQCCFGCGEIQNEYYACADIAIPDENSSTYKRYQKGNMWNENTNGQRLTRKKRAPFSRSSMQEGIQILSSGPVSASILPYTPIRNRRITKLTTSMSPSVPGNIRWSWGTTNSRRPRERKLNTMNRKFSGTVEANKRIIDTRNLDGELGGGVVIDTENTFTGSRLAPPMRSMIKVNRPKVTQIFRKGPTLRSSSSSSPSSPVFLLRDKNKARRTFISPISPTADALMISSLTEQMLSRYSPYTSSCKAIGPFRTKEMDEWCNTQCRGGNCVINECSCNGKRTKSATDPCAVCPYGKCADKKPEINSIYPGIFNNYSTFVECRNYEKIYGLGTFKVLSEGLPDCGHPRFNRFKRQVTIPLEEEEFGCCGTRPQVIMPLSVKSENTSFNVVQLPDDRNQFLVRGVCGRNSTVSCPMCVPEYNFQWVLVYDPRLNTNPPVNFVPVKFAHYCRCVNPGYNLGK